MSRFAEIETFVAVVETGSFSAASARLGVAVSAISRRVTELEARLGVRLANRSTRGFAPNAVGQEYYEKCVAILADLAEADTGATGEQAALSGLVRIAAPLTFGIRHLAPVLNAYSVERPKLKFDIDLSDRRVDIVEEGFDLAIRIGILTDSTLIARKLFEVRHVVAAAPAFWGVYGRPKSGSDLAALPALSYRAAADPSIWRYTGPDGAAASVRINPRYVATNGDFLTEAAIAGLGMIVQPTFICGDAIRSGALEVVLLDHVWMEMNAYAIWPPGRPLPSRVRMLVDHLGNTFGGEPPWDNGI